MVDIVNDGTLTVLPVYLLVLVVDVMVVMVPPIFLCHSTLVTGSTEVTVHSRVTELPTVTVYDGCKMVTVGGAEMKQESSNDFQNTDDGIKDNKHCNAVKMKYCRTNRHVLFFFFQLPKIEEKFK